MARFGLGHTRRLRSGREIREVLKQGQRAQDSLLAAHARPNGLPHPRLALAVSRRVSTKAVVRNRLKRLIRENFRHAQDDLGGLDIVIVARPPAASADHARLNQTLDQLWQAIRKRCNVRSSP